MKKRKEILLELTPLLDVILIMMFYILMQNTFASQREIEDAKQKVEAAEQKAAGKEKEYEDAAAKALENENRLKEELTVTEAKLAGEKAFEDYVKIVTISVFTNGDDRRLHVVCGETDEEIAYGWDDLLYAKNSLGAALSKYTDNASADGPLFIVFGYDSKEIFKRDFELVQGVLSALGSQNEHIYIKYSGGEER